jgi:hypothetical protein
LRFCPRNTHKRNLFFISIPPSTAAHFDYWNQPVNMHMRVCCLHAHEAGLCCYLAIHTENLLYPLQLFYFHLWPNYWLSLVFIVHPFNNILFSYSWWRDNWVIQRNSWISEERILQFGHYINRNFVIFSL